MQGFANEPPNPFALFRVFSGSISDANHACLSLQSKSEQLMK